MEIAFLKGCNNYCIIAYTVEFVIAKCNNLIMMSNKIGWRIEDANGKPIEKVRQIRDDIENGVKEIAESLRPDSKKILSRIGFTLST